MRALILLNPRAWVCHLKSRKVAHRLPGDGSKGHYMNIIDYWDYNEDSPSCLRWADGAQNEGKGGAERKVGSVAGSKQAGSYQGWALQVSLNEQRHRRSARRVVWEKHFGKIPDNHVIVHGDGNNFNNRIDNLACIDGFTLSLVKMWKSGRSTVHETETGKFIAQTKRGTLYIHISTHDNYEDAHQAYRVYIKNHLISTDFKKFVDDLI